MALYARIQDGSVVEKRELAEPPPAHKASQWKMVADAGQPSVAAGQTATRTEAVAGDQLVASYAVVKRPDAELKTMIKAEAQRRIVALTGASDLSTCLVKQMNALMRGTELTNKKASGQALTAGEAAEASALQAMADKIKAVRAASDALEVSLPVDFTAGNHWPAG